MTTPTTREAGGLPPAIGQTPARKPKFSVDGRVVDPTITESMWVDPDTGLVHNRRTQDVETMLAHNAHLAETLPSMHGQARYRHAASIPSTIAAQWARECGAAIGTPEFAAYAKRKIVTDYPKLLIKGW